MDYAMPRATDMPRWQRAPSRAGDHNILGVKGVGEAATTGAIATVMNADCGRHSG